MKSPIHIGLITPSLAGVTGRGSGIGVHFAHLAKALRQAGHSVTCVVSSEKEIAVPHDSDITILPAMARENAVIRLAGKLHWQFHQWLMCRARHRAVACIATQCRGIGIWETTSTGSPALEFLRAADRAPVITRVSTTASQLRQTNAGKSTWISRRMEIWERQCILRSDAVMTHTIGHLQNLTKEFGLDPNRVSLVPHGIPMPPAFPPRPQQQFCKILYVGRLEHRKGIDLLMAALPEVLQQAEHASVDFVGEDQNNYWEHHWKNSASPHFHSRIRFLGVISDEELGEAYRQADLFVAPSRYESFGLIFVEAMANALPVVALDAPGASDIIRSGETGLLAQPEEPSSLAKQILLLLKNPELRRRLGQAGREEVQNKYSLEKLAESSLAAYATLL